jgi:hypothetical protein
MSRDMFDLVAEQEGVSRGEVLEKIEEAIDFVYSSTDPYLVATRVALFGTEKPTPEVFVTTAARYVSPPK